LAAAGLNAVLVVGLHWHGALVGALGVGGFAADGKSWAKERMVLVEELGAFAGQLLGPQIGKRLSAQQAYRAIQGVIDNQEFEAVLQPVTAVTSGKVMGYEALCQFADGTVPDVKFVQAAKVGLRAELEAAMAKAAVDAAQGLDETLWLSVNFSPATVLCGGAERAVAGAGRPIVIEVAEYEGISSYPALRRALARCGGTRVSVDDRGSGYACLNHIDALRPDYVKLDIGLVRGIDTDRVRQSLAAGVCHFADSAGITLIAAGVQTEAELSEVSRLGATLLQGRVGGALVR
jgi:EAL domain-containing protein (putative c-di-GMP-specific phosphodiesterase class I)